jgi:hypothetical protein
VFGAKPPSGRRRRCRRRRRSRIAPSGRTAATPITDGKADADMFATPDAVVFDKAP